MKKLSLTWVLSVGLFMGCIQSHAQIAPARTLEQLKMETQDRANRGAYPLAELDPEGAREALAHLNSLDHEDWARAWIPVGDQHIQAGKALEGVDKEKAAHEYEKALQYYLFARFPVEDTPLTEKAYSLARDAFKQYARLVDPPFEVMSFQFQGKTITGYLRKPKGVAKPPIVITVGGLDSRKESNAIREGVYLKHGVAYLSMDMPGTGENKIKIEPGAEKVFSVAIDELQKRTDVDATASWSLAAVGAGIGRPGWVLRKKTVSKAWWCKPDQFMSIFSPNGKRKLWAIQNICLVCSKPGLRSTA